MASYTWDVKPLQYMVATKKEQAFKRVGAYIRRDARQSIRVSIRNSKPGEPPKAKRRNFKNSIRFAADKESVVVGPVRAEPANSTPHILEAGGWRQDTLGRIRARWERANPEKVREERRQEMARLRAQKKANAADGKPTRIRSKRERMHIREYYQKRGQYYDWRRLSDAEKEKVIRFRIARRPYMEPALNKNKQKTLALLAGH